MKSNITRKTLFVIFSLMSAYSYSLGVYNVKDYGAKGNGIQLDNAAINRTIDSCAAHGGGQVVVPAGTYLCGSIRLKSNIDLHIMAGAKIKGAPESMDAYDKPESFDGVEYQDGGHTYFHNSLIWGEKISNVSITGQGLIDGSGLTKKDTEKAGVVKGGSIGTGDKSIALKLCRDVLIRDITICHGGHFGIIITGCDLVNIDNVTIDTNRDGIDIDCCRFTTVSNCKVNTPHDDAIVLKSSYALKKYVACDHILIDNCIVTGYKEGTFLDGSYIPEEVGWVCGRIKLGTESNGGYRNITISNCTCIYSSGLALEEVDQGKMENIVVSNISMSHVHHYPIYITTGCRNRGPKECKDVSSARDIQISNVTIDDADSLSGIQITGMKAYPLKNIRLSNIQIRYRGGGNLSDGQKKLKELEQDYPEPRFLGRCPSYGLFARHVEGLDLSHITFLTDKPDYRPAIILDDVKDANVDNVTAPEIKDVPIKRYNGVTNLKVTDSPLF